ncbi:MAG: hypothetical protein H0T73_00255 [Ardenticatenales bacterium]|nr:hypothetical protein [Ardenticatenales bacterium]
MAVSLKWLEVWVDGMADVGFTYVLVLQAFSNGIFQLYDPQTKSIIKEFDSYEDATAWLHKDEYELVETRWQR